MITAVRVLQGVGFAAFISSAISAVADMSPLHKLGFYMAVYRIVSTLSFLTGPAASMYVAKNYGYNTWFFVCTIMGILSIVVLLMIKFPKLVEEVQVKGAHPMLEIFRTKKFQPVYLGIGLTSMCYGSLVSFAAIHISRTTDIGNPGIYFTFFAISSLFFHSTFRYSFRPTWTGSCCLAGSDVVRSRGGLFVLDRSRTVSTAGIKQHHNRHRFQCRSFRSFCLAGGSFRHEYPGLGTLYPGECHRLFHWVYFPCGGIFGRIHEPVHRVFLDGADCFWYSSLNAVIVSVAPASLMNQLLLSSFRDSFPLL